jgi:hypothetical protein
MKTSLITAVALAGVLALTGCGTAATGTETPATGAASSPAAMAGAQSSASAAAAPTATASAAAASTEGKVHFTGDYTKTTAADSDKIIELAQQWYSPAKEATLREKMASTGLAAKATPALPDLWYASSVTSCQARFDGHILPLEGFWGEVDSVVRSVYCPEVG